MTTAPRHWLPRLFAAAIFGLCLTGGARAALLQWDGTLTLEMIQDPEFVFGGPPEGGGVATLNASGGGDHLTTLGLAGGITGTGFTVPGTSFLPLNAVSWNATLGSGLLVPISGGATAIFRPVSRPSRLLKVKWMPPWMRLLPISSAQDENE